MGNPKGLEGTFSQGIVSSIREVGTGKLLQITAPISHGSSGGPVLNAKGEVIGVSVATVRDGQNLNFAIPSNYLKTLLVRAGPAKPLAEARSAEKKTALQATETVYVTKTGTKYHRAGCRNIRSSSIPMRLAEAASRYGRCTVCRPPAAR